MRTFTRLAVLFYVSVILALGTLFLLFLFHKIDIESAINFNRYLYENQKARNVAAMIASIIMLKSFLYAKIILGRQIQERTIAFDNPTGRVLVSLTAIEDMVRRVVTRFPEVREIRPFITAHKKGLEADIRLILQSEVNIPDLTMRLQEIIKSKIQEAVGIEGKVLVRVHVLKVVLDTGKLKKKEKGSEDNPPIPFQGYRA